MNDRARAIEILKRARDMLAERLTERVLESRGDILEDAMGLSYVSEIDAIHEQLGARLSHVTSMLNSLPKIKEPPATDSAAKAKAADKSKAAPTNAIPGPKPVAGLLGSGEPVTFKTFAIQIHAGNIQAAGASLATLFAVDKERGVRCAEVFHGKLRENPELMNNAAKLRHELSAGNINATLELLWECFGLQGMESLGVLETLRTHL